MFGNSKFILSLSLKLSATVESLLPFMNQTVIIVTYYTDHLSFLPVPPVSIVSNVDNNMASPSYYFMLHALLMILSYFPGFVLEVKKKHITYSFFSCAQSVSMDINPETLSCHSRTFLPAEHFGSGKSCACQPLPVPTTHC